MQRKIVICDRCGKEFDPKVDRAANFRYQYLTDNKLLSMHDNKPHGEIFINKDICEDCYEQFKHFISQPPQTVPNDVEEAFNSICQKLTGLDRAEVMHILNEGSDEQYEKLFEMALDIICLEETPLASLRPIIIAMHEAVTEEWVNDVKSRGLGNG